MSRRMRLISTVAVAVLASVPATGYTQRISVAYFGAPLRDVIENFARYSGRTILVGIDLADAQVTMELSDAEWRVALDRLLAPHGLVARENASGIISIDRLALTDRPGRVTVTFYDASLGEVVKNFATYSGRTIELPADLGNRRVTAALRDLEWEQALDAVLAPHGLVARHQASGAVVIERRLPRSDR